ncbi:MAG TPA: Rho termination factor N-terminal domain-containing protein, partial [Solirubrobacteraceae bacterium]
MPVLDRSALEASPLADLHAVASELSLDGYRRLRRAELITAILEKQGVADPGGAEASETAEKKPRRPRTRAAAKPEVKAEAPAEERGEAPGKDEEDDEGATPARRR